MGVVWVGSAVFFAVLATVLGSKAGAPSDGCLLAICNVFLAVCGGALGFLATMHDYPWFILGALAGAFTFPLVATVVFVRKLQPR
jgi:hypothetical protein